MYAGTFALPGEHVVVVLPVVHEIRAVDSLGLVGELLRGGHVVVPGPGGLGIGHPGVVEDLLVVVHRMDGLLVGQVQQLAVVAFQVLAVDAFRVVARLLQQVVQRQQETGSDVAGGVQRIGEPDAVRGVPAHDRDVGLVEEVVGVAGDHLQLHLHAGELLEGLVAGDGRVVRVVLGVGEVASRPSPRRRRLPGRRRRSTPAGSSRAAANPRSAIVFIRSSFG